MNSAEPEGQEDDTEDVQGGDLDTSQNDQELEHSARDQGPAAAADHPGQHDGSQRQSPTDAERDAAAEVLNGDRHWHGQDQEDRLEHQHRREQPSQDGPLLAGSPSGPGRVRRRRRLGRLVGHGFAHDRSAAVKEWRPVPPSATGRSVVGASGVSNRRASPTVMTEPVISTPPPPGRSGSGVSSARPTAISMASSIRSATCTRSRPNTSLARSASSSAGIERSEELRVTTTSDSTGSSSSRMPATSLSALIASTPTRRLKLNASFTAATVAAMPAGLWAASPITVGLRRSTSSRPGERRPAKAWRIRSTSSGARVPPPSSALSVAPAKPSTAARAQAALDAWCSPNKGRNSSG